MFAFEKLQTSVSIVLNEQCSRVQELYFGQGNRALSMTRVEKQEYILNLLNCGYNRVVESTMR